MARRKRAPMSKKVYDWHELVDAISSPPVVPSSEIADHVRGRIDGIGSCVQLTDRLVAFAGVDGITLRWFHTPRGEPIGNTTTSSKVAVYPAAGGRTTYAVDNTVDGHFANKHLPLNAKDRAGGGRRTHRSTQWFCGRSGLYQKGQGPYYPDAGPDSAHPNLEKFETLLHARRDWGLPQAWAEAAAALCGRITAAVSPFRDVIVRYEGWLPSEGKEVTEGDKIIRFSTHGMAARCGHPGMASRYGVRIRLKSPCETTDGGSRIVPDFSAFIAGPDPYCEASPDVWYGAELLHPSGSHCITAFHDPYGKTPYTTSLDKVLYRKPAEIIEAARQWAASRIFIPV